MVAVSRVEIRDSGTSELSAVPVVFFARSLAITCFERAVDIMQTPSFAGKFFPEYHRNSYIEPGVGDSLPESFFSGNPLIDIYRKSIAIGTTGYARQGSFPPATLGQGKGKSDTSRPRVVVRYHPARPPSATAH